ncbi:MAG: NADPH-dependent assimilatory sulfite reductase hemoprotein subunit, partial [Clostridia bacterium]|nr:NADPH-dependent assimilatory sulfite reductase hemoprotein subunit [Clostridia bacterium]
MLAEEVANDQPAFSEKALQVLKHHGTYQQDDRDKRREGKTYIMMVRVKVPGGVLTWQQMLAQLDLCDELGNTTARITDRQDLQLHGVLKRNLREAIRRINEVQMTTLGACGDVVRNVICCPAPLRHNGVREELQELARAVTRHLLPRTPAYHQIWLTDPETQEKELVGGQADPEEVEPIYGKTYLPRKFKIAFGLLDDNCVDVYANDLGFVAIVEDGRIAGFNVLAGGSLGVTPSNKNTFPALAKPVGFISKEEVIPIAEAVVKIFRDFGERGDRKRARLK